MPNPLDREANQGGAQKSVTPIQPFPKPPDIIKTRSEALQNGWDDWYRRIEEWRKTLPNPVDYRSDIETTIKELRDVNDQQTLKIQALEAQVATLRSQIAS